MIEIIKYQRNIWHMQINGKACFLHTKPIALFVENNLLPKPPNCSNVLRWRVNRKWISYLQIKRAILNSKPLPQKAIPLQQ